MRAGEEPILQHEPPAQIHASAFGHRELERLREALDFLGVTPKLAKPFRMKEADSEQSERQHREPDPDCSTLALAPAVPYLWLVGNGRMAAKKSSYNCAPFLHSLLS